jgi:hypothetical protein
VTAPQSPVGQLRSHEHAELQVTEPHAPAAVHSRLQLPWLLPHTIVPHAPGAVHDTSQLLLLHVMSSHAPAALHSIVQCELVAHVSDVHAPGRLHVMSQWVPLGHVKSLFGSATAHTGGSCVVSHESHCDGHGLSVTQ